MAFTLTVEDINSSTDEDFTPELETAWMNKFAGRATKYLAANGHVVKPTADYESDVTTRVTAENQKAIDQESAKLFASVDGIMKLITGEDKPEKMRTRDWVESKKTEVEAFITANKNGSATDKALVKQLQDQMADFEKKNTDAAKAAFDKQTARVVRNDLRNAPVPVDPALKTDTEKTKAKADAVETIQEVFNAKYDAKEDGNGELYFQKKGTTEPLMNVAEGRPMTPLEIIRANHRSLLAIEGHSQAGAGTGGSGGRAPAANSEAEILKQAAENGLKSNTQDWKDFVNAEKKKAGIA